MTYGAAFMICDALLPVMATDRLGDALRGFRAFNTVRTQHGDPGADDADGVDHGPAGADADFGDRLLYLWPCTRCCWRSATIELPA